MYLGFLLLYKKSWIFKKSFFYHTLAPTVSSIHFFHKQKACSNYQEGNNLLAFCSNNIIFDLVDYLYQQNKSSTKYGYLYKGSSEKV